MVRKILSAALLWGVFSLTIPSAAFAYPFGGKADTVWPCFNAALLAFVGPPDSGLYIWTTETKTYQNGPPGSEQWLLGLTGIPYICLVFPLGPIILPGMAITMMGSSQ